MRGAAAVAPKLETAIDLARTHMVEARRSVGALRPNVGDGEDVARALKRIADLAQRGTPVPIEINVERCRASATRVEREILGIAQEALTNAVRHSRARRITMHASTVGPSACGCRWRTTAAGLRAISRRPGSA